MAPLFLHRARSCATFPVVRRRVFCTWGGFVFNGRERVFLRFVGAAGLDKFRSRKPGDRGHYFISNARFLMALVSRVEA